MWVRSYVAWVLKHGRALWLVTLVLSVPAFWRTAHVFGALRGDLESLLPDDAPSVLALQELRERMDGTRELGVVVDAASPENLPAAERLLDDLAARVRKFPPALVAAVRTDLSQERAFVESHAPLYVTQADLEEVRRRVEARRDWEVAQAGGFNLEDEPAPSADFSDIEARYRGKNPAGHLPPDGRLSSTQARVTLMLIDVPGYSTGTRQVRELMGRVRGELDALGGPQRYAAGMKVGFAGSPVLAVEELSSIQGDLTLSGVLVIFAVIFVLIAYYRWWPAVIALGLPLVIAVAFAFSLASLPPFRVTWVNSNTAFLASIIVGNGINFGIILLARYREERRRGASQGEASQVAVHGTLLGTATAAGAAAIAYGSLATTHFRGFWQFGVIGGLGMLLCWACAFVLTPSLLAVLDRAPARAAPAWFVSKGIASVVSHHPRAVAASGALLTLAALFASRNFGPSRFDTDFSRLRRIDNSNDGARYWGQRMEEVLGQHLSPVVVLTRSPDQTVRLQGALRQQQGRDPVLQSWIGEVRSFRDLVPEDQPRKLGEVSAIRTMLTPAIRARIPPERRAQLDRFLSEPDLHEVRATDIPATLTTGLRERDGTIDRTVLVYPKPGANRWQGASVAAFTDKLRQVAADAAAPGEAQPAVAGQVPLSADITRSVLHDAPRATAVALLGVLLLVVAALRLSRQTVLVLGSLLVGVLWLVWLTMLLDIHIHFANFVAFPIAFGIGIDYAVNVASRHKVDGGGDVMNAVRATGGAVGLCSLTTIIGYSSLLLADNRGLVSFGLLSVLGELACLASAWLFMPAVLLLWDRGRTRAAHQGSQREGWIT
jgi:uncharacterized protein